jgi:hypothetical protein
MHVTSRRWATAIGRSIIAVLWLLAGYLLLYYALLFSVGPDALSARLGIRLYNALFPLGGFNLIFLAAVVVLVWGGPFALVAISLGWLLAKVRRRWPRRIRLAVAVLAAIGVTASLPALLLDGWPDPLWALVLGDDTEYAPQYSALGYWRIRPGMTQDDVLRLAGAPLERYPITRAPNQEGWRWTRSPRDSSYRVRVVIFANGRVVQKVSEFYVD